MINGGAIAGVDVGIRGVALVTDMGSRRNLKVSLGGLQGREFNHVEGFRGNLAHYRLQLLVPALYAASAEGALPRSGCLRVERGPVRRIFHVDGGCLRSEGSNRPTEHLAQILTDLDLLEAGRSAAAFEAAEQAGTSLGQYLLARGEIPLLRLVEALEHKAREAFFDCYEWESGEFEFTPGPPQPRIGAELQLELATLHRDALLRRQEWKTFWEVFRTADTSFVVDRRRSEPVRAPDEEQLLLLAERGTRLSELLAGSREGRLHTARRLVRLYRRGVLTPRSQTPPTLEENGGVAQLLGIAQGYFAAGDFESAAAMAGQALERAPVPEAHSLYRESELRATVALAAEISSWEGKLKVSELPRPAPVSLTSDELYLHSRLKSALSVRELVKTLPMGELAAFRSIRKLLGVGALRVEA